MKTREGEEGEEHEEARCPPWAAGRTTTRPQWAHRMAMACPGDLEVPWTMVSGCGWLNPPLTWLPSTDPDACCPEQTAEEMAAEASGDAPPRHCPRPGVSETSTSPATAGSAPHLPTGMPAAAGEDHHREATITAGADMAATVGTAATEEAVEDTPMVVDMVGAFSLVSAEKVR